MNFAPFIASSSLKSYKKVSLSYYFYQDLFQTNSPKLEYKCIYVELNLLFSSCFQERDPPTSVGAGVTHGEISLETFSGTVEDVQQGTNGLAAFNSQISSSLQLELLSLLTVRHLFSGRFALIQVELYIYWVRPVSC